MKKTLAILLALVLCFSCLALVACNDCDHNFVDGVCTKCGDKDPNYKPNGDNPNGGNNDAEVPVVDGKVTFYFTLSDASVTIPSYASIYFVGGQTGWAEDDAHPFIKLGDTNIYYVQIAYDATKSDPTGYKITLGYNSTSGLAADSLGVNWTYQSDECPAGLEHLKYTYNEGDTKVNLGTHTFSTEISEPIRINTTLAVTFLPALPETAEVYIIGSVNGWNTSDLTKSKATADANRETYTLPVTDVICGPHQYKILVFLDGTANVVKPLDKDGKEMDIWNWQRPAAATQADDEDDTTTPAEKKYLAYIEISAGKENLPIDIAKRYANSTVDLAGTRRRDELDKDGVTVINARKGLDVLTATNLTEVEGEMTLVDADGKPILDNDGNEQIVGNGIWATKYILTATKTLKVSFADALPEGIGGVYVIGAFRMNGTAWGVSVADATMAIAEDRLSASVTYTMLPGSYEYNVLFMHKDYIDNGVITSVQSIWDNGVKLSADNLSMSFSGFDDGTIDLAKDVTVPTVEQPIPVNVTLRVKLDKAVPEGKRILIAGTLDGWSGTEMTVDANDATVYTLTKQMWAKEYEFLILYSGTASVEWTTKYGVGGALGGANAKITIANDSTIVDLFGETVLQTPEASVTLDSVTLQVTFATALEEGKHVWFAGDLTAWGGNDDNEMTANTDRTVFTLTLTNVESGNYGFKLCVNEEFDWNKCLCSNYPDNWGGDNASVTIKADSTTIALFNSADSGVVLPA